MRKSYEKLGVPLFEDLIQGGNLNGRSISWTRHSAFVMTVFDRDLANGTCLINFAQVYGPGEWNQYTYVVAILQNIAQTLSRDLQ